MTPAPHLVVPMAPPAFVGEGTQNTCGVCGGAATFRNGRWRHDLGHLDAPTRPVDSFTLRKPGYHSPSTGTGRASAVDIQAPSQCGACVAGLPMSCSCSHPGAVRVELGHSGYRLVRDDTAAFLEVDDPKSIQIGDPPSMSYNPFDNPPVTLRRPSATDRLLSTADDLRRREQALRQARQILAAARVPADIVLRLPKWQPGDVIVVEYAPGKPYTYVRGQETWPVDKGRPVKTDDDINRLYEQGKVRPVLQSGGVPFSGSRLP